MWTLDIGLKNGMKAFLVVSSRCNQTVVAGVTNRIVYIVVSIEATHWDLYNARRVFNINNNITS